MSTLSLFIAGFLTMLAICGFIALMSLVVVWFLDHGYFISLIVLAVLIICTLGGVMMAFGS